MFNSHARVLHGSGASGPLAFYTTCCRREISLSHLLRAERHHAPVSPCCAACVKRTEHWRDQSLPLHTNSSRRSFDIPTSIPSPVSRNVRQRRPQNSPPRRDFHTKPCLLFQQSRPFQGFSPGPKRSGPLPPAGIPRFPPQGPPLPRHPFAKPVPPSGSRRRAGKEDDDEMRLSNPIEEMRKRRERRLQELRIPQRMAEWDKRIQEVLPVAQARLNSYKVTRATIRSKVAEARKIAHAEWRVKIFMSPLDAQFERCLADVAEVQVEFVRLRAALEASREALRHFHRSLYLQATQALGEVKRNKDSDEELRSISRSIGAFDRDLDPEGLKPLMAELAKLDLWKEPLRRFPFAGISPRGAASFKVRRALSGILFVRKQLDNNAHTMSALLHLVRRLRRHRGLHQHQPEVFQYLARDNRLYFTMHQLSTDLTSITVLYHDLRMWLQTSSLGPEWKKPFYVDTRVHMLLTKMSRVNQVMQDEYHDNLSNITAFDIKSDFALQQTQLLEFKPILLWVKSLQDIYDDVKEMLDATFLTRGSGKHTPLGKQVKEWIKNGKDMRRELWVAIDTAISWRGAANMCFGSADRPRRQSLLMTSPSPTPKTDMPRPILGVLAKKAQTRFPWQVSQDLYPRGPGIPIHFVATIRHAETLVQRFADCKVVGIDLVLKPTSEARSEPEGPEGSPSTPVDYMVLASDDEVAIFHLGWMSVLRGSLYDIFQPVLGNSAILKVGVGLDRQCALLANHYDIELEELHDLTLKGDMSCIGHVTDASNQPTLSSVVAQTFGSPLPKIDLSLASFDLASRTHPFLSSPQRFFTCLASRGYATLQLYHSACRASGIPDRPGMVAPGASDAAFGPVLIQTPHPAQRFKGLGRVPLSRSYYMQRVSRAMVEHVFRERKQRLPRSRTYLRALEAYYLFTSFRESLKTIKLYLRMPNPAAVIYDLARRKQLPLRQEDLDQLLATINFESASAARARPLLVRSGTSKAARKQAVRIRARPAAKSSKMLKIARPVAKSRKTGKGAGFAVRWVRSTVSRYSNPPPPRPSHKGGSDPLKKAPASKLLLMEMRKAALAMRRRDKLRKKRAMTKVNKKAAAEAIASEKAGGKVSATTTVVRSAATGKGKPVASKPAASGDGDAKGSPSTVYVPFVQILAPEKVRKSASSKPAPAGGGGGAAAADNGPKTSPSTVYVPFVQTSATERASKSASSKAVPAAATAAAAGGGENGDSGDISSPKTSPSTLEVPPPAAEASSKKRTKAQARRQQRREALQMESKASHCVGIEAIQAQEQEPEPEPEQEPEQEPEPELEPEQEQKQKQEQ